MSRRRNDDNVVKAIHPLVEAAIAQGLPATVDDPVVLARIAVLADVPTIRKGEVKRAA